MSKDAQKSPKPTEPKVQVSKWLPVVLMAWAIPGAGHIYLKRTQRGALLGSAILVCFFFGLMMRGAFFEADLADSLFSLLGIKYLVGGGRVSRMDNDLLLILINGGGHLANIAAGIPYYLSSWLGYNQPDVAGHSHDYGTKFLVGAGLLNILSMVDAWEIVTGEKD